MLMTRLLKVLRLSEEAAGKPRPGENVLSWGSEAAAPPSSSKGVGD